MKKIAKIFRPETKYALANFHYGYALVHMKVWSDICYLIIDVKIRTDNRYLVIHLKVHSAILYLVDNRQFPIGR